ncbi:hypothetical protein GTP46_15025 [Duganella sp. FT135W]|uniref:Uncharacterized protein n=1 Tax=Duganella flavida TaxID=2692175 RepID=A0A6L8KDP6_9BURK|nr:hypothetical protein [Duganella flavida]MYM23962.1 hypothetical protein [Duganella flavida]
MISITNAASVQATHAASREAPFFGTVARPSLRDSYISVADAQESAGVRQSIVDDMDTIS